MNNPIIVNNLADVPHIYNYWQWQYNSKVITKIPFFLYYVFSILGEFQENIWSVGNKAIVFATEGAGRTASLWTITLPIDIRLGSR